jgi:hypothetical protein
VAEVLDRASKFFGKDGLGLTETERNPCCIFFEGGGGHVSITLVEEKNHRSVNLETREYDFQAQEFLQKL